MKQTKASKNKNKQQSTKHYTDDFRATRTSLSPDVNSSCPEG